MSRNSHQKQKLLYVREYLLENTDEEHGVTMNELVEMLDKQGIKAERKSIYDDLEVLRNFGLDICAEKSRTVKYFIGGRDFQVSELKLLVDAIQSSKFITEKKSLELITKLERLAGKHAAKELHNQVIISRRVKTANETIYYNVDRLHDAINHNRAVSFYYNQWVFNPGSARKIQLERRHGGALYNVSPWELCWDDENYYLIGYDEASRQIRHYRVDKMERIELTERERKGVEEASMIDPVSYSKSTFSMFAGEPVEVTLSVKRGLVGVIADRFGTDVFTTTDEQNENNFIVKTTVNLSDQFFGWLCALGDGAKIISPENAVSRFKEHVRGVMKTYEEADI